MGLISKIRPVGIGSSSDWTRVGGAFYAPIADEPGYPKDTNYIRTVDPRLLTGNITFRSTFIMESSCGSDPIAGLNFNVRWQPLSGTPGLLTLIMYRNDVRYQLGTFTHPGSGWTDSSLFISTDPATGGPWSVTDLAPARSFTITRPAHAFWNDGAVTGPPGSTVQTVEGDEPVSDFTYMAHSQASNDRSTSIWKAAWPTFEGPPTSLNKVSFHFRVTHGTGIFGILGQSKTITMFQRVGGVDTDISVGASVVSDGVSSAKFRPQTIIPTTTFTPADFTAGVELGYRIPSGLFDISISQLYAVLRSGSTTEFGFEYSPVAGNDVAISSFNIEDTRSVGPTDGRYMAQENWRYCDICGRKVLYSSIRRPQPPHPKAGLSVCRDCYDEIDHETRMILRRANPERETDTLY